MAGKTSRRAVLRATAPGIGLGGGVGAVAGLAQLAAAEHSERGPPDHVTVSYDDARIAEYQPQLVLDGVSPEPLGYYGLHAESEESSLNAVYGFVKFPYQEGRLGRADGHLGDHEPIIVWYDSASGEVERVDYAAYHWFHGWAPADAFQYADEAQKRPMVRVDPAYHHFYIYSGAAAGERLERENLLEGIDGWLANGLEENLALSQPFNPWDMFGRESWWRHNRSNRIDASLKALWFNLGLADASKTSDVSEVSAW